MSGQVSRGSAGEYQADERMGFSRQDYWSGLPGLLQGIFLTQGLKQRLLRLLYWQEDSLLQCHLGSPSEVSL